MKKSFVPTLILIAFAGCGCFDQSPERMSDWERIAIGDSRAEIEAVVGPPDSFTEINRLGIIETELHWIHGKNRYAATLIADITIKKEELPR